MDSKKYIPPNFSITFCTSSGTFPVAPLFTRIENDSAQNAEDPEQSLERAGRSDGGRATSGLVSGNIA
jgi:hypothetical protein